MYNNKMYFKITNNFVKVESFFTVAKCGCLFYHHHCHHTGHASWYMHIRP